MPKLEISTFYSYVEDAIVDKFRDLYNKEAKRRRLEKDEQAYYGDSLPNGGYDSVDMDMAMQMVVNHIISGCQPLHDALQKLVEEELGDD